MTPFKKLQCGVSVIAFLFFLTLLVGTFAGLCGSTNLPDWWLAACGVLRGIRVVPSLVLFALFMATLAALGGVCDACGMTAPKSDNG
ncbi:MAG: hypothetical protein K2W95_35770 [Candidatus Obscuribacterales bacterium]|nr:hypothetical protein [Candidatus Obscuribacterales bacterium]